uniref:C-type lectin domain-containing protein n=1 Tax=Poecilia formosa TaxID=48698 RepID=A0A096MAL2_POEFO
VNVKMSEQQGSIKDLTTEKKQLIDERQMVKGRERRRLMDPGCKPCLHDWILFQKKCYLFYDEPAPWKTWEQSRRFCQDRRADLVVINDLEEQEFVSKHVKSYFDIQWGYWLGLQQTNNTWTWVDGHVDTLGFWMKEELKTPGPKARLMPGRNPSESWNKADSFFQNKFICEHEAFPRIPY